MDGWAREREDTEHTPDSPVGSRVDPHALVLEFRISTI